MNNYEAYVLADQSNDLFFHCVDVNGSVNMIDGFDIAVSRYSTLKDANEMLDWLDQQKDLEFAVPNVRLTVMKMKISFEEIK